MSGLEPLAGIAGKAAAGKAAGALLDRAIQLLRSGEMDRLFADVSERLNAGVGPAGLGPVREAPNVIRIVARFLEDATSWDEEGLVDAIEPYVGQLDEETTSRDFARQIASAIRTGAWRAKESDREALVHRIDRLESERALWAKPRYLSPEWIPKQALDHVIQLSEKHPDEAAHLEEALHDETRRPIVLRGLVRKPPQCLKDGSGALWTTLGQLALAYGLEADAETAFVEAADDADVDRAHVLATAAQVALIRGETARAFELLDEAQG